MDFKSMGDKAILQEFGDRIRRHRLNKNITQNDLAKKAGVASSVVQKLEKGEECRTGGLMRIFRALEILDQLDSFLPDPGISPLQIVNMQSKERWRATGSRGRAANAGQNGNA